MNVAICEDQEEWIGIIEDYLSRFRQEYRGIKWEAFNSAEELIKYTENNEYIFDILITDIEMSKMNGIELANVIRKRDSGIVIFFLSSHEEYIRQCFQPGPLNFWDKPLSYELFKADMEKAISKLKENDKVFSFKGTNGYYRIPFKNIVYFRTNGKKIIVHTNEREYEFYGSFKAYEKIWVSAGFVKANRFYCLNSEFISTLKSPYIILTNGESIQATPSHVKNIKMLFFENDCKMANMNMGDDE